MNGDFASHTSRIAGDLRTPAEGDFWLEDGYVLERVVGGLTYTSNAVLTPDGELYVLEAGFSYPYIFTTARLSHVLPDGQKETIVEGLEGPAIGLLFHEGAFLVTHRGHLSRITLDGHREDLITGLPALGDHHTNHLEMVDGKLYFGQGSATNAGVVGPDNLVFYGWLKDHPEACDIPPYDVKLSGVNFESKDGLNPFKTVETGAFLPFGTPATVGQVISGQLKASSVIYQCNPDGTDLRVYAWGFRNPYSVAADPDGHLFCLDQGSDIRGTRPVRSLDTIWEVVDGAWYGFPDFLGGRSVPELADEQGAEGPRGFVMEDHPEHEMPFALVPEPHAGAVQMQFSTSDAFGYRGHAFIADYGSAAPFTTGGKMIKTHQGVRRFDPTTRQFHDFCRNENPGFGGGGPERATAVRFSPDGHEMYVSDYGIVGVPKTGAVWRIRRS